MLRTILTPTATLRQVASLALAAACTMASAVAQTAPARPAATSQKATAGATHKAGTASTAAKLPANIPAVRGIPHSLYSLRYIDTKIGTGALAEPGKLYSVHYTGWLHDGTKFDSSVDRGKPIEFPQGAHRVIPGWDTGFEGMHIGGKRRLFIPWQLAYGETGRGPIPPKADLIFDIELVDVKDMPRPPAMAPVPRPVPAPPAPEKPASPGGTTAAPPSGTPATPPPAATPPATPPPTTSAPATPPPADKPNL